MNLKLFYLPLIIGAMGLATSCKSDDPVTPEEQLEEKPIPHQTTFRLFLTELP